MPADYGILANIHDTLNMSDFAQRMTGRLVDYAQRHDWMGRKITDIGCGTGESLAWLSQHGYIAAGVDKSAEMLAIAEQKLSSKGLSVQLVEGDLMASTPVSDQDMILALDVLSELNNIRELEHAFKQVHQMLRDERLFVFDVFTIEGLAIRNEAGHQLRHDANGLTVFIQNQFDYEKSIQERDFTIFRQNGSNWQRDDAQRILRAYPVQAVTALVQRAGFSVQHVLNEDMSEHKPGDHTSRVIVFAQKR